MFLWRAVSDILPTTTNLLIKRVDVEPQCAMCGISQEDTMHALVLCDYARNIWEKSNLTIPNIVTNVFHDWFDELLNVLDFDGMLYAAAILLLNVLDFDGMLYAAAILYNVWRARNMSVWEAKLPRPEVVLKAAAAAGLAWTQAHPLPTARAVALPSGTVQPQGGSGLHGVELHAAETSHGPPRRICRVDGGFMQGTAQAAFGAVLLDTNGGYAAACSGPLQGCSSPLMAEALACKEALSWLKDRGEQNVEIYTDSLTTSLSYYTNRCAAHILRLCH
ncbi:PREDICTED: uncharacterized protein LOC109192848 [Ipomoea nil]|uniref:uncharacterized protein LOC109192848 n=1 Tax=Ipomoea nil TaxID=35883 RepID=UPI000901B8ED|nr:PREDICTED: uncharacterized protein LOC109192848 [Ipomoea nil]